MDFTLPTIPGGPNITDNADVPWWGLYLGAGEANLKEQGFTMGTNQSGTGYNTTTVLNTERLWQDKSAPQWGSGK